MSRGSLLAVATLAVITASADAGIFRGGSFRGSMRPIYRPAYSYNFPANRMPGWDWKYQYPYVYYDTHGYWPANYPYPYQPYPTYYPMPVDSGPSYTPSYHAPITSTQQVVIPHPSGELRVPPVNAAFIQIYLPDEFGTIQFDGVKASSIGTTRYYVTPDLKPGKEYEYKVTATFKQNGKNVTVNRTIDVAAGQTRSVDFTKK